MATNPAVPFWDEGNTITCHARTAVTGKRFVSINGPRVEGNPQVEHRAGSATVRSFGVSGYDAPTGGKVSVYGKPGIVMPVTAAEAITAGDDVYSAADGRAVKTNPGSARPAGVALDDAAIGADAVIKLA